MQRVLLLTLALVTLSVIQSCDDDDGVIPRPVPGSSFVDIDIVTGIELKDANGNQLGRWRWPNVKPGAAVVFPNPSTGQIALFSNETFNEVWLVPANCLNDSLTEDIMAKSEGLSYELSQIDSTQIRAASFNSGAMQVLLDYNDVPTGFYRLFYMDGNDSVFWHNLFIDPASASIPSSGILDAQCE